MSKSNRVGVTLRFKQSELRVIQAVLYKLAGHTDLKKGLKDMIVNVVNRVLEEIRKENAAAQERAKDEQGDIGNTGADLAETSVSEDPSSNVLANEENPMDTDGQSRTGTDV